ncbi:spermatogenesis-associated protein 13 isoform X1 [Bemisia tabaci]
MGLNLKRASSDAYRYRMMGEGRSPPKAPQRRVSSVDPPVPPPRAEVSSPLSSSGSSNGVGAVSASPLGERKSVGYAMGSPTMLAGSPVIPNGGQQWREAQQRSLSLPKSFQAATQTTQPKSGLFNWGKRSNANSSSQRQIPSNPSPEAARTAPPTPEREESIRNQASRLAKTTQYSSTPALDDPVNISDWNVDRWVESQDEPDKQNLDDPTRRNIQGNNVTESVLNKFRKSFSLRFAGNKKAGSKDGDEDVEIETIQRPDSPKDEGDPKFRFGPLVWRTSKERKKARKARSAKCNSGDSGIHIEMGGRIEDSSESHDTDILGDDDTDSPLMTRKRTTPTSSDGKPSRPSSDVINQLLLDKLKMDSRNILARSNGQPVRRTHSDLGGQRLLNWDYRFYRRRMLNTSPLKSRPPFMSSSCRGSRPIGMRSYKLRRSISQPLGLNELSPVMRKKPIVGRYNASEDERGGTSDDEMMSDSESSIASLNERKKSFEQATDEEVVVLAEAVWDHVAMEPEELMFRAGDVVEVKDTRDRDWWWGSAGGRSGWFPAAFVRLRVSQGDTVEDCLAALATGAGKSIQRRASISRLSNDEVRAKVVRELVHTERDFVKLLTDVAEGYLAECRRRTDMFTEDQINTIFSNLPNILRLQSSFLEDLESKIDWSASHKSCVGEVFLKHKSSFRMYSEYCNSHPLALSTLQDLYQLDSYSKFFEACRLMRGLIEIPLDGYLLTPIQRICKYPLQLAELLKYTKPDHPDHEQVSEALEAMKNVAVLINERKRRMESLEKLALWQQRVEGWDGVDLIEQSSQLIHQGEAVRMTSSRRTANIIIFLFDHQLIYCKKDILKRNTLVYKGRMPTDYCEIYSLPDGKDGSLGVNIRNGIKICASISEKTLVFCCRSEQEKGKWLEAFSEERKLVEQDKLDGLEFAPAARQLARTAAARCHRRPPSKPRNKYKRGAIEVNTSEVPHMNGTSHSSNRKAGSWWYPFGTSKSSSKKNRTFIRANNLQPIMHPA